MRAKVIVRFSRVFVLSAGLFLYAAVSSAERQVVLVREGVSQAPVIIGEDALRKTREAAKDLSEYIYRVSGARPEVIEGEPGVIPETAIWVGYQSVLDKLFPDLDFEFEHPEEILISANESHLVIAGRDRWDPEHLEVEGRHRTIEGYQQEYGTANAVYAFVRKYLNVAWLWPGDLGLDIIERETIAFPPFEYRYHPQFRQRTLFGRSRLGTREMGIRRGISHEWSRFHGLQLDSLSLEGGHAFVDWWEKFSESNPEYFALQPDRTRSGYPSARRAKLCQSNPDVWRRWLLDVESRLEANPNMRVFNASPNDSAFSGICVCEDCLAWDHPGGEKFRYRWARYSQEYAAMTDRYVAFWNNLSKLLRERYPEKDFYISAYAYGPSKPTPVEAELEDNIILAYVGGFPFTTEVERREQKTQLAGWAETASRIFYRPNLWYRGGGVWGFPEVAMGKTIEDLRFLADNNCAGLYFDGTREHFASQGPQHYLLARLAWNPYLDGQEILDEYYTRGFGPAAGFIREYWELMEDRTEYFMGMDDLQRLGGGGIPQKAKNLRRVYDGETLRRARDILNSAADAAAEGPEVYPARVAFVRAGLDVTALLSETISLMDRARESGGEDTEAVKRAAANWDRMREIADAHPHAFNFDLLIHHMRVESWYMGGGQDYLGPPSEALMKAAGLE